MTVIIVLLNPIVILKTEYVIGSFSILALLKIH